MKKFYQLTNKSIKSNKVKNIGELWEKMKAKGYKGFAVPVKTVFTKAEGEENLYHAVFSTASVDRHGDIVEQNWILKHYKKNPVYLDSHDYSSIEKIIGKIHNIKGSQTEALNGDIEFATVNPRGQLAKDLADGKFLNTSSVGFIPKKFDDKWERIIESELLEISAVSVPANPEALYEKKYGKSIDNPNEAGDEGGNKEPENSDDTGNEPNADEPENNSETEPEEKLEEQADEVAEKTIKKTADELLYEAIKSEVDIRNRALNKVYNATKLICEELKVGTPNNLDDREKEKSIVNKAIRELLDFKKALK